MNHYYANTFRNVWLCKHINNNEYNYENFKITGATRAA